MALARRTSVWAAFAAGVLIGGMCVAWQWSGPQPAYAAERISLADLAARVADLEELLTDVRREEGQINGLAGPHLIFEGCNVHVRNGEGFTSLIDGTGNLIVGFNEESFQFEHDRRGSHNLVIGEHHTYSFFGGFVGGQGNSITGPFATVSGGFGNEASGFAASVSGGAVNHASGNAASVTGGGFNEASGGQASVTGGDTNLASHTFSCVSGGFSNVASGSIASVTGGFENVASGNRSSVNGGRSNVASGLHSTVSGGRNNTADADDSHVP